MKKIIITSLFVALALVLVLGSASGAQAAAPKSKMYPKMPATMKKSETMMAAKSKMASKMIVGKVTSMTDTSLQVKMGDKDYTVNVDSSAKVVDRMNKAMKLSDVKTGDKVSVSGAVTDMTVQAKVVRDVSTPMPVQAKKGMKGKKPAMKKTLKP